MVDNNKAVLLPIQFEIMPNKIVPMIEPIALEVYTESLTSFHSLQLTYIIEPIHDASNRLIAPEERSESFDKSVGSEGDNHPTQQP